MVVCVIIPTAVMPTASSFLPQSPPALSATQSRERKVRRHVHTDHRSQRQRFGAVMSTARREQTGKDQHGGKAKRPPEK
jgi:hypothetical protein